MVQTQVDGANVVDVTYTDGSGISRIIRYGHLSNFNVVEGQLVNAGDVIGYVGNTGNSTGSHLHISTSLYNHRTGKYTQQDPEKVLKLCKYNVKIEYDK